MSDGNESLAGIAVPDPLVGTIFDKRFRVEDRIASGGFGAIYRAVHVKSGHPVALKVLHQNLASDLGVLARFRREGTTLTSLRNPHTITAYEFGQFEHTLFIVMELLYGESLFDHFDTNGPLEWRRVVNIARQVCESLEEAHALGIVHRDLKPTNIHLETVDGERDYVKVLDFGIAKIVGASTIDAADLTNAGQMIGTLDYMSPEQMVGGQVTGQTDIYTLGILMYELIAGTRPFPEAATPGAVLAAMLRTTPEPLHRRSPIPREVDRVVMRCLERETQKRYRTVADLRADLERVLVDVEPASTETLRMPSEELDGDTALALPSASALDMVTLEERRTARPPDPEWDADDESLATSVREPDSHRAAATAAQRKRPDAQPPRRTDGPHVQPRVRPATGPVAHTVRAPTSPLAPPVAMPLAPQPPTAAGKGTKGGDASGPLGGRTAEVRPRAAEIDPLATTQRASGSPRRIDPLQSTQLGPMAPPAHPARPARPAHPAHPTHAAVRGVDPLATTQAAPTAHAGSRGRPSLAAKPSANESGSIPQPLGAQRSQPYGVRAGSGPSIPAPRGAGFLDPASGPMSAPSAAAFGPPPSGPYISRPPAQLGLGATHPIGHDAVVRRERFIRRVVWTLVILLGLGVGFIVATQL